MALKDNNALYDLLVSLNDILQSNGFPLHAERAKQACSFAAGSPSEFLHESQLVLKSTIQDCSSALTEVQVNEIREAIDDIDTAFARIGGA